MTLNSIRGLPCHPLDADQPFMERLRALGCAVLPGWYGTKLPEVAWKRYQPDGGLVPTDAQHDRWFRPGRLTNAVLVTGWASIAVLDFDDQAKFLAWQAWTVKRGGVALEVMVHTLRVKTARGMHLYVKFRDVPHCGKFDGGDIKGAGGYVLIPPSVHPTGAIYACPDVGAPIVEVGDLDDVLPDPPPPPTPARHALIHVDPVSSLWPATLTQQIKAQISILSLFPNAKPSGGRWYVDLCPWHEDRAPSLRIDTDAGVVACFAGCTDQPIDVINTYAKLHNLDVKNAIKELGRLLP